MLVVRFTALFLMAATLLGGPGKELHQFLYHRNSPVESGFESGQVSILSPVHDTARLHDDCPATVPASGNKTLHSMERPGIIPVVYTTEIIIEKTRSFRVFFKGTYRSRAPPLV